MKSIAPQVSRQSNGGLADHSFTVVEYFAGIGLFRMGLENAGWQIVYANDWSYERAQIYDGFFGESYDVKDVFDVGPNEIPQSTLATCSFPCVDLSLAGNLRGLEGRHSSAFWGFYHLLRAQGPDSPPLVLLENVAGWLSANGGQDFYTMASALNDLGYACDAFTLDARAFVPQSRPRVFLIGIREVSFPSVSYPVSSPVYDRSKRILATRLSKLISGSRGIRWAQLNIPEPPPNKTFGFTEEIAERLEGDDPRWWPKEKVDKHLSMMSPPHLAMVKQLAEQKREEMRTFYRRSRASGQRAEVRNEDIAGCLRTAIGGSGKQFLVAAGNGAIRMRTLTPREYARLQGVPDYLEIKADSERQALNAFGDAVCVPAVTWIANNVLNPLAQGLVTANGEGELKPEQSVGKSGVTYGRQCSTRNPKPNNGSGEVEGHEAGNAGASPPSWSGVQIPLA